MTYTAECCTVVDIKRTNRCYARNAGAVVGVGYKRVEGNGNL